MLFGDSNQAAGLNFAASGFRTSGPSSYDMFSEDRAGRRGSSHCSRDGSSAGVVHCETVDALGSSVTTNSLSEAKPDTGYPYGDQSWDPLVPNGPLGGGYLSPAQIMQIIELEKIAAQDGFAMTWPWGAIQGTFPPDCGACNATPPVVGASTSDFADTSWSPNSDPTSVPTSWTSVGAPLPPAVPGIPQWAMLLIGFGGLALIGRRLPRRPARLDRDDITEINTEPGLTLKTGAPRLLPRKTFAK